MIFISILMLACRFASHAQFTAMNAANHYYEFNDKIKYRQNLSNYDSSIVAKKDAAFYKTRSEDQKTGAWCIAGAGTIVLAIGLLSFPKNGDFIFASEEDQKKSDRATTVSIIGAAVIIASTPLFISSSVNKRKARLLLKSQQAYGIPVPGGKNITSLALAFSIGK